MKKLIILLCLTTLLSCRKDENKSKNKPEEATKYLDIYSHRKYDIDEKVFDLFEKKHDVKIRVTTGEEEQLFQKIDLEKENPQADLLMTIDCGTLNKALLDDLLMSFDSKKIEDNVPSNFKDKDNKWVGVTYRSRVIAFLKKNKKALEKIKNYDDILEEDWEEKILIRSSGNIYNKTMFYSFIDLYGEDYARKWSIELVNNLAREPKGNDRDQLRSVYNGVGELAIVNSYYLGKMLNGEDPLEKEIAEAFTFVFPDQEKKGTHINLSTLAIVKGAKNNELAIKFIEFMTSREIQELISNENYEYPVNQHAKWNKLLEDWGTFKIQKIGNYGLLGGYSDVAEKIQQQANWN